MSRSGTESRTARERLRERVDGWAARLRVQPARVHIQPMRHKWGSCSARGTITLSCSLLHESADFRDFVIVHELLHLQIRNHGRLFRARLGAHCPQWQRLGTLSRCQ